MILLFIEWPEQCDLVPAHYCGNPDVIFVASNVHVVSSLEKRQLPFVTLDEALDKENFFRPDLAIPKHYEEIFYHLDECILSYHEGLRARSIRPFLFNYYYLRLWIDMLEWVRACLMALLSKYNPERIVVFQRIVGIPLGEERYYSPNDPVISEVICHCFPALEKEIILFDYDSVQWAVKIEDQFSVSLLAASKWSIRRRICARLNRFAQDMMPAIRRRNYFSISEVVPTELANRAFLKRLDMGRLIQDYSLGPISRYDCNYANLKFKFDGYFESGISFILWERVSRFILSEIPSYILRYDQTKALIQKYNPLFLEMSSGNEPDSKVTAQAFRDSDLPIYIHHHGALAQHLENKYKYIDFTVASDYFVYGDGVSSYIEEVYPECQMRLHNVGNNKVHYFRNNVSKDVLCAILKLDINKPIFAFQLPGLHLNHMNRSFDTWGDFSEYADLKRVVDFFEAHADLQLIIKGHPSTCYPDNPMMIELSSRALTNVRVIRDLPMSTLIASVDYCIMNRPSTGMLEALVLGIPVLIYNSVVKFWGQDSLIQEAAAFWGDIDGFIEYMEHYGFVDFVPSDKSALYVSKFANSGDYRKKMMEFLLL